MINMEEIVFYKKWFRKNQKWLLRFANTWIGRKILYIDGDKSEVGKNKIVKIEPNAIHWRYGGVFKGEYRTGAKFAHRLYFGLKPIWDLMHLWDLLIGERFSLFGLNLDFGFSTLTAYPDAHPESLGVDGWAGRIAYTDWAGIRDGEGTHSNDGDTSLLVSYMAKDSGQWYGNARSFFLFDTGSIGGSSVLLSATMSFWVQWKEDGLSINPFHNLYKVAPANNIEITTGDYNTTFGGGVSSDKSWASISEGWCSFAINSADLNSSISKTYVSKFGCRNTNDSTNVEPGAGNGITRVICASADYSGTTYDPRLVVTYGVEAYVTNSVSFEVEDDIPLTISNPNGAYLKAHLYVGATLIKSENIGNVTSHTISPSAGEVNSIYSLMSNVTSSSMYVRIQSYLESGYTTQIGSNKDKTGTVTINQTTNKPAFSAITVENVDKNVAVKDKYDNTLVTSSTSTLLGANSKMIKGYSKVSGTVAVADKAVAQNSATMVKYRFTNGGNYSEESYSAVADVVMYLDNCTEQNFIVTAYDSRNLTTGVNTNLTLIDYTPCSLYSISVARDNQIDTETKLVISGAYWDEYFGGGTAGTENTITAHYRYKETTESWGAQTWNSITLTDTDGVLSYNDYINGDTGSGGADGFDASKSYDIEVRIYDKLSQSLLETTLNRGEPLMDMTSDGLSVGGLYDTDEGGVLQISSKNVEFGWFSGVGTWAYSSWDDTGGVSTAVITVPSGATSIYGIGMRIKFTQSTGGTKYGIITRVQDTALTVFLNTDYTFNNEGISNPCFSMVKCPFGFDLTPTKWQVTFSDSTNREQPSPTQNTWYNLGAQRMYVPIGLWNVEYFVNADIYSGNSSATYNTFVNTTLSTANNSEVDENWTWTGGIQGTNTSPNWLTFRSNAHRNGVINRASTKAYYYLNTRTTISGVTNIRNLNDAYEPSLIRATIALL